MLVFLDIDGVLRRDGSELYRFQADLLRTFEETLSVLPEAAVVITSSWREAFGLGEIRSHFSPGFRRRVIGATPIDSSVEGHRRYREVKTFLSSHGRPDRPWVAVDDDAEHYPAKENVIIVDGACGFDRTAAGRMLLAAGFGPFRHPESVVEAEMEAEARPREPDPDVILEQALSAPPPAVDIAMRALWDFEGDLPGPVAAPEGRWRTPQEQAAVFKAWWLRRGS